MIRKCIKCTLVLCQRHKINWIITNKCECVKSTWELFISSQKCAISHNQFFLERFCAISWTWYLCTLRFMIDIVKIMIITLIIIIIIIKIIFITILLHYLCFWSLPITIKYYNSLLFLRHNIVLLFLTFCRIVLIVGRFKAKVWRRINNNAIHARTIRRCVYANGTGGFFVANYFIKQA